MRTVIVIIAFLMCSLHSLAQEQTGYVKTVGRPDKPGKPLDEVMVRAQGTPVASVTDSSGNFSLVMAHYKSGQSYSLSRVSRQGYQLADGDLIGRKMPFSEDIPLEISMVSKEDYANVVAEIESQIRSKIDAEYKAQMSALEQLYEEKRIGDEEFRRKCNDLIENLDNSDKLIEKLADRYAKTDYDRLDSLDKKINSLIETGKLEEAESLILSKGSYEERKAELDKHKESNEKMSQLLAASEKELVRKTYDLANDLYTQYEIARLRFDNKTAAYLLKKRMELDSSNMYWGLDYASFIRDYLGNYDESHSVLERLQANTDDITVKAIVYHELGILYEEMAQIERAVDAYKISVELKKNDSLSNNSIARTYGNLAGLYFETENFTLGVSCLSKAKTVYTSHSDSLGLASVLLLQGNINYRFGKYKEAISNMLDALSIKQRYLNEAHREISNIYSNLSVIKIQTGDFNEALSYIHKAIEINGKIFGNNHPVVANNYVSLASVEMKMGNGKNALENYERSLDLYKQYYGDIHPRIAIVYGKLASYYKQYKSDFDKSVSYYLEAKSVYERLYGKNSSYVANMLNNLGSVYSLQAKYAKAIETYEESAKITESIYGSEHISLTGPYHNIGVACIYMEDYAKAEEYLNKSLNIFIKHFGDKHIRTAVSYFALAQLYQHTQQDDKALDLFHKVLQIYRSTYGDKHPKVADVYESMAKIYLKLNKLDHAGECISKSIQINIAAFGENHENVGILYGNLFALRLAEKSYAEAKDALDKGFGILSKIHGEKHILIASCYSNYADLFNKQGDYTNAIDFLKKSIDITESLQPENSKIPLYKNELSQYYIKVGDYENALTIAKELYASQSKDYIIYLNNVYTKIMQQESYDAAYDVEYEQFNKNLSIVAQVKEGSLASQKGLSGRYTVVAYEEWSIIDGKSNMFVYVPTVAERNDKTYILYKDGEYVKVTFSGVLGITLYPEWIDANEKQSLVKSFKKLKIKKVKVL